MRAILANAVGAVAALSALGLGLVVGAPEAGADRSPAARRPLGGPPPRLVEGNGETPLGDGLEVLGRPTRMSAFWTRDEPRLVADLYAEEWRRAGLEPEVRVIDRVTSVSAMDKATGLMRQVTIMDSGEDRLVLPGMTDLRQLPDLSPSSAPVPIPETARNYDGQFADDATALNFHGSYVVPNEPEEVVAFYRDELVKRGYAELEAFGRSTAAGSSGAEFQREREFVRIVATDTEERGERAEGARGALVVVTHARAIVDEGEEE